MSNSVKVAGALGLVYLFWGTSFLAVKYGVEVLEPFLFASLRFYIAAPCMFCLAMWKREKLPKTAREWLLIVVIAIVMQAMAVGLTTWGQQWVPSGEAALIISSSALWIALFGSLGALGDKVGMPTWLCIVLGLSGLALLIATGSLGGEVPWYGYVSILVAALCWSSGSMALRRFSVSTPPTITAALHLFIAANILLAISFIFEEPMKTSWTPVSLGALVYVGFCNSFIGFAAYYWLIYAVRPAVLGTFAYMNPAIAVTAGVLIANETFTRLQLLGTGFILASVILIVMLSGSLTQSRVT